MFLTNAENVNVLFFKHMLSCLCSMCSMQATENSLPPAFVQNIMDLLCMAFHFYSNFVV